MNKNYINSIVRTALKEDEAGRDITSRLTLDASARIKAVIVSREKGVLAGLPLALAAFLRVDKSIKLKAHAADGEVLKANARILSVEGKARSLLAAERTALNFLGQLSGIATLTSEYVRCAGKVKVYDTRKTHAGLREAEKYAVRMGGGHNHRQSLKDAVMVKDNHRAATDDLGELVAGLKLQVSSSMDVIVEVESMKEALQAAKAGANLLLLDNLPVAKVKEIARVLKGVCPLEVTGGVTLKNIGAYAKAGAERVSIGRLTHSAPALDFSLEVLSPKS